MAFCVNCGSQVKEGSQFCGKCGTKVGQSGPQAAATPTPATVAPVASETAAPVAKGMSTGMKLVVGVVVMMVVVGVLGMVGVYYAAHRVSEKFHEVTRDIAASGTLNSTAPNSSAPDPCRYLSKQDVGKAIGVEIVATQADGDGCSYLAAGTQADMSAKHTAAMVRANGADAQAQKTIQQFAGGMFKAFSEEKGGQGQESSGNVPVLVVSVRQEADADAEMRLNAKVMGGFNSTSQGVEGIGNQAFVSGDSLMMIRKDDKLVRIMYMTCPCSTKEIKPLARKLVASL